MVMPMQIPGSQPAGFLRPRPTTLSGETTKCRRLEGQNDYSTANNRSGLSCFFVAILSRHMKRPTNSMPPESVSRMMKTNGSLGFSIRQLLGQDHCGFRHWIHGHSHGFGSLLVDLHRRLMEHGRDEQVALAIHAGNLCCPAKMPRASRDPTTRGLARFLGGLRTWAAILTKLAMGLGQQFVVILKRQ